MPPAVDFAPENKDPDAGAAVPLQLTVPMAVASPEDEKERMAVATRLGVAVEEVPSVRRDDTDVEIEWSLSNSGMDEAHASLAVNGANELFKYDPLLIPLAMDQEAPPSLMGGRPITVPAGGSVNGVLREDELSEGAQDLDAISRAGYNIARAVLTRWATKDISGGMGGTYDTIPSEAVPLILQYQMLVATDRPLRMTASLRVRDRTGRLRPTETDPAKLVPPSTTVFVPPVMMTP